ncbi:MAG: hypothetical protein JHD35_23360 [Sphingopyxis sp.]|nr:hypothetical protein [Sphingopyxis sp.]
MTIEQHIEELRAELNACTDAAEFAQITREYQVALEQRIERDKAFDAVVRSRN